MVGDRLDTDIEGARRAGAASLLVLTGVTDPGTLLAAPPEHRPDLLSADAAGLLRAAPRRARRRPAVRGAGAWAARLAEAATCCCWRRRRGDDGAEDGLDGLRALCVAHWSRHPGDGAPVRVRGRRTTGRTAALAGVGPRAGRPAGGGLEDLAQPQHVAQPGLELHPARRPRRPE